MGTTLVLRHDGREQRVVCGSGRGSRDVWESGGFPTADRRLRCVDRGGHVHGQDLFLRIAALPDAATQVLGESNSCWIPR